MAKNKNNHNNTPILLALEQYILSLKSCRYIKKVIRELKRHTDKLNELELNYLRISKEIDELQQQIKAREQLIWEDVFTAQKLGQLAEDGGNNEANRVRWFRKLAQADTTYSNLVARLDELNRHRANLELESKSVSRQIALAKEILAFYENSFRAVVSLISNG